MRLFWYGVIVLFLFGSGSAFGQTPAVPPLSKEGSKTNPLKALLKKPAVRVTRIELFQGDAARLEPHLDFFATAAVKVDFPGKNQPILIELIAWHNGKKLYVPGPVKSVMNFPAEITFSLKQVGQGTNGAENFRAKIYTGNFTQTLDFTRPKLEKETGMSCQEQMDSGKPGKTRELTKDKAMVLWWFRSGNPGLIDWSLPIEERARGAEGAESGMVLKLSIRELDEIEKKMVQNQ
jgi:hypothetical protein